MSTKKVLEIDKDRIRENFNKYIRKAFQMLSKLNKPRVLDTSCAKLIFNVNTTFTNS